MRFERRGSSWGQVRAILPAHGFVAHASRSCFQADRTNGLTRLPNTLRSLALNQTTPPNGPPGTASQIIFNEDNTKLIASVKGVPPAPGFLAVWDVQPDGSLSATHATILPAAGGMLPFSMNVIPGQNALFATDAGVGFAVSRRTS